MASRLLLALGCALAFLSCVAEAPGDGTGQSCAVAAECPLPLSCVQGAEGTRTCQSAPLPEKLVIEANVFFCTDIKPIFDARCNECHAYPQQKGAPKTSRLDVWEDTVINGATVAGAFKRAAEIKVYAVDTGLMPPPPDPPLTNEEQELVATWVRSGAPNCRTDGGTTDGGTADGG